MGGGSGPPRATPRGRSGAGCRLRHRGGGTLGGREGGAWNEAPRRVSGKAEKMRPGPSEPGVGRSRPLGPLGRRGVESGHVLTLSPQLRASNAIVGIERNWRGQFILASDRLQPTQVVPPISLRFETPACRAKLKVRPGPAGLMHVDLSTNPHGQGGEVMMMSRHSSTITMIAGADASLISACGVAPASPEC